MHDENCLVQMLTEGTDGGRHFFKCPRAWVMLSTKGVLDIFNIYCIIYIIFCVSGIQCSRELRVRTMGRSSPNSSSRRVHLLSAESYLRFRNGSKQRQQRRGGRWEQRSQPTEVSMHYSILQLPVSQQQSASTATTSCYGSILWRRFDTIC